MNIDGRTLFFSNHSLWLLHGIKSRKVKVLLSILMKVCSKNNLDKLDWLAPQNILTLYDITKKMLLTNGEYF